MRRLFSFKTLFLVFLAAGIGAIVALVVNQKQKFAGMSEEEIRAYLDQKLAGKMSDEQVGQIQDAVVAAVKGTSGAVETAEETLSDAVETATEEAEEAAEEVEEVIEEAVEEAAEEVEGTE